MEYDGFIFDCDGTLTDSMPLHYIAWRDSLALHGLALPEPRFYAMAGMPTNKIIGILSEEQGIQIDVQLATDEKENAFFRSLHLLEPIPQVVDRVRDLHGKIPISVASGGTRPSVLAQLKQIGLENVFDVIVTAEDTERHKPEPDVFLRAAKLMNVAPEKCCVYEDADLGIQAAQSANMAWVDIRAFHVPKTVGP